MGGLPGRADLKGGQVLYYDSEFKMVVPTFKLPSQRERHPNTDNVVLQDYYPPHWKSTSIIRSSCVATDEVYLDQTGGKIQSSVSGVGNKTEGGDEFYVFAGKQKDPDAVAFVEDDGSGVYRLHWIPARPPAPGSPDSHLPTSLTTRVVVILEYSCSLGLLDEASIQWANRTKASQLQRWTFERTIELMPRSSIINDTPTLSIKDFPSILGVGDSLTLGFMLVDAAEYKPVQKQRVEGARWIRVSAPLTSSTMEKSYLTPVRDMMANRTYTNRRGTVTLEETPTLLIMNGGCWNALEPIADPEFEQLAAAMDTLLHIVQQEFPDLTIAWLGMDAMHVHRVDCEDAHNPPGCWDRVKYMSTSRGRKIDRVHQRVLARHPRVHFLPWFNRTYISAHCHRPNDGIHFIEECNQRWWSQLWDN